MRRRITEEGEIIEEELIPAIVDVELRVKKPKVVGIRAEEVYFRDSLINKVVDISFEVEIGEDTHFAACEKGSAEYSEMLHVSREMIEEEGVYDMILLMNVVTPSCESNLVNSREPEPVNPSS